MESLLPRITSSFQGSSHLFLCDQASPCSGVGIVVVGRAFGDLEYGHCVLCARERYLRYLELQLGE